MKENKGMSRAAQKKRKRENKQKKQFALKSVIVKDQDNDERDEEDSTTYPDALNSDQDNNDDDDEDSQQVKFPKIDEEILFTRIFTNQSIFETHSKLSLEELFDLRDIKDVTATQRSSLILSKLLLPNNLENFYDIHWQKLPVHIHNNERERIGLENLQLNKKKMKKLLTENIITIDEDIRVIDSKSLDPLISMEGLPSSSQEFFRYFLKGKGIILLQPQKYEDSLWKLFSALEYEFNTRVDGNIILQPQNHIFYETTYVADRFFIQLEGKSSIRYPTSAMDLQQFLEVEEDERDIDNENTETAIAPKAISVDMQLSDIVYLPQGFPLEIKADPNSHSVMLLICTNRKNSVADLLQFTAPTAIGNLKSRLSFLNMPLPMDINAFVGVAASEDDENPKRKAFTALLQKSLAAISKEIIEIIDPAVDQFAKNFTMERLPVPLSREEEMLSSHGSPNAIIHPYTQLRVLRPGIAITVIEDGKCVVYHCMDNARELYGNPINPLEFDLDDGPSIEALLHAYPDSVTVSDLEHPSDEIDDKISIAQALYKEGILVITDVASRPEGYESENQNSDDESGIL